MCALVNEVCHEGKQVYTEDAWRAARALEGKYVGDVGAFTESVWQLMIAADKKNSEHRKALIEALGKVEIRNDPFRHIDCA